MAKEKEIIVALSKEDHELVYKTLVRKCVEIDMAGGKSSEEYRKLDEVARQVSRAEFNLK